MTDLSETEKIIRTLCCWGKTGSEEDPNIFHPALFHMLDVACVAEVLLQPPVTSRFRKVLAEALNVEPNQLVNWLPSILALHDIGKISSAFQSQNSAQLERLRNLGFDLSPLSIHHTLIGQIFLLFENPDITFPHWLKIILRDMTGGHHGRFSSPSDVLQTKALLTRDEPGEWREMRKDTLLMLLTTLNFRLPQNMSEPRNLSAAIMLVTGFTILCDWLGSDEKFFPPSCHIGLEEYLPICRRQASNVVEWAGLTSPTFSTVHPGFKTIFNKLRPPRPIQISIDEIPDECFVNPMLAIIEAPTGEGKTEAALALSHRIAHATGTDELYYALPTTATSNQMYIRVQRYLHENLILPPKVKLVHGQAFLIEDSLHIKLPAYGEDSQPIAMDWFGSKKKGLLSPFGVGTIDQAELGALNVNHVALRLLGLAGKVVIIDEVHAYDVYMTTIIERLLAWLSQIGTSVILLSATLPQARRTALLQAYAGDRDAREFNSTDYPNIFISSGSKQFQIAPKAAQPHRRIQLSEYRGTTGSEREKAIWLVNQIAGGGCACWITNTVDRAQKLYAEVRDIIGKEIDLDLIHSRYCVQDRQILEEEISLKYGPGAENRPYKGIVIGTQVLEQSLDLDFDVMISDIAPVDLLLQRAGRLHRHDRARPPALASPQLWIAIEVNSNGEIVYSSDGAVYSEYILRLTRNVLDSRLALTLPQDYRVLIEAVYNAPPPEANTPLGKAYSDLISKEAKARETALMRLLPTPNPEESFSPSAARLHFDESETSAAWSIAQTRLGEESLNLIPLVRTSPNTAYCLEIEQEVRLDQPASRELQFQLLQRAIRLSHRGVVTSLKNQERPFLFSESAFLRDYFPLWLEDGQTTLSTPYGQYLLRLDSELGFVIKKC